LNNTFTGQNTFTQNIGLTTGASGPVSPQLGCVIVSSSSPITGTYSGDPGVIVNVATLKLPSYGTWIVCAYLSLTSTVTHNVTNFMTGFSKTNGTTLTPSDPTLSNNSSQSTSLSNYQISNQNTWIYYVSSATTIYYNVDLKYDGAGTLTQTGYMFATRIA
jgi:hypothetical protein